MTFVEAGRKRRRWSAGAKTAAITLTLVATAVWIATACITGNIQICDPANWTGGVKNPAFLKDCCDPSFFDGGIVTWPPCPNYGGSEAGDGGDASADGPIEPPCSGQCVAFAPLGWDGPSMVWIGPQPQAPACPDTAPMDRYEGHDGLPDAGLPCWPCQCGQPTGSCDLPLTLTASSSPCPGTAPGAVHTSFDPPLAWDGGCTSNDAVAAGPKSIIIAPLTVNDAGCTPSQPPLPNDPLIWSTFALACLGATSGSCDDHSFCAPPPAADFHRCVSHDGDEGCDGPWLAPYTEKHVFFDDFDDARNCSSCTCGPPAGGVCSAEISIYSDGACGSLKPNANPVDSTASQCFGLIAGAVLGSKSASASTYDAGPCEPDGGAPTGAATPTGPTTFCCIPQP